MNPQIKKQLDKLQNSYGLSFTAAIEIMELVRAFDKYDGMPQACKDSVQVISDMFNVSFIFHQKVYPKRPGKMALTGICTPDKVSLLYADDKKVSKFIQTGTECHVVPGGENKFVFVK